MHAEALAKMAHSRKAVIELLLTWLEVGARHGPRSFRCHLARTQLLLDFPPAAEKLDEWRATIRSLVGVANKDEPRPAGPSSRRSVESPHRCTLLPRTGHCECRSVVMTLVLTFP